MNVLDVVHFQLQKKHANSVKVKFLVVEPIK